MKKRPVGDGLFHADGWAGGRTNGLGDRRTGMTKLIVMFRILWTHIKMDITFQSLPISCTATFLTHTLSSIHTYTSQFQ